jgi:ATP-dependent exoDNAse (exonuclease V) alpha subunit
VRRLSVTGGWITLAMVIAACSPVDSKTTRPDVPWYKSVVEPAQSDADRLAKFYDRLLTMKGSELASELDTSRKSFEGDKSELNRLQLALLLSLPGTSFRDDNAALAFLGPFVKDKGGDGSTLRTLALWLHSELLELRRSDEALQQQAAKLKEEQRRAEALQQKLDAILDMEMKMIEREQNLPKKK